MDTMTPIQLTEDIISLLLDKVLATPESFCEVRIPGLKAGICAGISHMSGFYEDDSLQFADNGFAGPEEFMAHMLQTCDTEGWADDYMLAVYYPRPTEGELSKRIKYFMIPYYFALTDDGLRILQASGNSPDPVREMKSLRPLEDLPAPGHDRALAEINTAILALGKRFKLPFAGKASSAQSEEKLLQELVALLLKPDQPDKAALQLANDDITEAFRNWDEASAGEDGETLPWSYSLLGHLVVEELDWKFSREDMENLLETLTGAPVSLAVLPPEPAVEELFAHVQELLSAQGWALLHYNTGGDMYLFFTVYKEDLPRILELCDQLGVPAGLPE